MTAKPERSSDPRTLLAQYRDILASTEARLRNIIEESADGIVVVDHEGIVHFVNPAAEQLLGEQAENLVGGLLGYPLVAGKTTEVDIVYRAREGGIAEMRVVDTVWNDQPAFIATLRDMTDRRHLENQMRQLFQAIEQSPTPVVITDISGTIEYVNPQFSMTTGYAAEEVIGQNPRILNSGHHPPEFFQKLWATISAGERWQGIVCNRRKNGEIYWEMQSISPVRDAEGHITHYVAVKVDDTERQVAVNNLRRSEERYRLLFERAHDAILITNEDDRIVDANPAAEILTGYARGTLRTMHVGDLDPEEAHTIRKYYEALKRTGSHSGEMWVRRQDGSLVQVEFSASQITETRYQSIVRDITSRKLAERQALELAVEREKVKVLERFISDVSHDLRTPFAAMRMSIYLIGAVQNPEEQRTHLAALERQTARLEKLLDDMLSMARLDTEASFDFETLDINRLVHEVLTDQTPTASMKRHRVQFDDQGRDVVVNADKTQLYRAVTNIVVNALHYTPDGGEIAVETARDGDEVVLRIRDNGVGIPDEDLPHIFKRFYRGDKARGTDKGGTGLGLAIAQKVVETHHGRIEVSSTPGLGTIFSIFLPSSENAHAHR